MEGFFWQSSILCYAFYEQPLTRRSVIFRFSSIDYSKKFKISERERKELFLSQFGFRNLFSKLCLQKAGFSGVEPLKCCRCWSCGCGEDFRPVSGHKCLLVFGIFFRVFLRLNLVKTFLNSWPVRNSTQKVEQFWKKNILSFWVLPTKDTTDDKSTK